MNRNRVEFIPDVWSEGDVTFFGLVAFLFPHKFCAGASVLLASNSADSDEEMFAGGSRPPAEPANWMRPERRPDESACGRQNQPCNSATFESSIDGEDG